MEWRVGLGRRSSCGRRLVRLRPAALLLPSLTHSLTHTVAAEAECAIARARASEAARPAMRPRARGETPYSTPLTHSLTHSLTPPSDRPTDRPTERRNVDSIAVRLPPADRPRRAASIVRHLLRLEANSRKREGTELRQARRGGEGRGGDDERRQRRRGRERSWCHAGRPRPVGWSVGLLLEPRTFPSLTLV